MYCPHCGSETPENAQYCPDCGQKLQQQKKEPTKRRYTVQTAIRDYFQGTICERTLYEYMRRGVIPYSRVGTKYILREEALDEWCQRQEEHSQQRELTCK